MGDIDVFAGIVGNDGHLGQDKNTIFIINSDVHFLKSKAIPMIHRITGKTVIPKPSISGFGKLKYKINVSSAILWRELNRKYNIPSGAKPISIQPPNLNFIEEKNSYLSGWIAGDGSVTIDRTRVKIEIWSKSSSMISWFREVLKENGIESKIFEERNKNEFILRIGKRSEVMKFYEKIEIPHPKKQNKLRSLLFTS